MTNIIGFRLLPEIFGNADQIIDALQTINKPIKKIGVYEEQRPYIHYHGVIYVDMSVQQFKKWIYNHKKKSPMRRQRNNIWVDMVSNEEEYLKYIAKENGDNKWIDKTI